LWAYQHNIATGTTVNAGNPCTNAEALTFLWRAEGKPDKLNTLAASGTYYGQPVAWADKNGLITGTEIDPDVPCSRADLMGYLYWVVEEWTPSEEEQKIQTEYDKILYNTDNPPKYADYVDVDGDGRVELLTLDRYNGKVIIAIYANMDGHIEKSCEGVFQEVEDGQNTPVDTFLTDSGVFSLYSADGQLYLCQNRSFYEPAWYPKEDDLYDFYKIGKESITFCEQRNIWMLYNRDTDEEQHGDTGTSLNYTKIKDVFCLDQQYSQYVGSYLELSILDEGISLPEWEECKRYWTAYWEASDPTYTAMLNGDFSAIAGNYEGGLYEEGEYSRNVSDVVNKDGTMAGDGDLQGDGILSVTVMASGEIYVLINYYEEVDYEDGYTIYFPECVADLGVKEDLSKVRISYWSGTDGTFVFLTKTS